MRLEKMPYISFFIVLTLTLFLGLIFISILYRFKGGKFLKRIKFFYLASFISFILSFITFQGMVLSEIYRPVPDIKFDYMIVLGSGNRSGTTKKRVKKAASYASRDTDIKIIAAGGKGKGEKVSEAEAIAIRLKNAGINRKRILLEDQSHNTFENIKFSKNIIEKNNKNAKEDKKTVLIVTSDFHIFRAVMIAERMGLTAYGLPSQTDFYFKLNAMVREYFAFIKDWFYLTIFKL